MSQYFEVAAEDSMQVSAVKGLVTNYEEGGGGAGGHKTGGRTYEVLPL